MRTVVFGDFEWDEEKAAANALKHGVTFDEAADALTDPNEIAEEDLENPGRVRSLVLSPKTRVLFVVTTEAGDRTRILSARKANRHEERIYEGA